MKHVLPIALSLLLLMGIALADDSEFRLVVSQNDGTVGGEYQVKAQIKITDGQPSPKVVNSLTLDVPFGATLSAPSDAADLNWFTDDASVSGYECSLSKLDGYYRILVTSNGVSAGTGWQITNSTWSDIVTLRWVIGSVLPHEVTLTNTTDAAAYYTGTTGDSDAMDWATTPKEGEELKIAAKVFLQGPYSTSTHLMSDALNTSDAIPNAAPYDDRSVGSDPADIPVNVTDWVSIGLRSTTTGKTVNFKSVFLDKNGLIVADDGTTPEINIYSPEGAKDYYIVVDHRNHLQIMSSTLHSLSNTSSTQYDFTDAMTKVYNSGSHELESGTVYGMISADADNNKFVNAVDAYNYWVPQSGTSGYKSADFNLDGFVNAIDAYNYWIANNGRSSTVPSN